MSSDNQFLSESTKHALPRSVDNRNASRQNLNEAVQGSETFSQAIKTSIGRYFAVQATRFLNERLEGSSMGAMASTKQTGEGDWMLTIEASDPTEEFLRMFPDRAIDIIVRVGIESGRFSVEYWMTTGETLAEALFKPDTQLSKAIDRIIHGVGRKVSDRFAQLGDTGKL
jgi:hypothetical protein